MFFGAVPEHVIQQVLTITDFSKWKEIYVCCSGGFRIERALLQANSGFTVRSNDVSLFSAAVAGLALKEEFPISFHGQLDWIEGELVTGSFLERTAAMMVAFDMSRHATGGRNRYKDAHVAEYRRTFKELVAKTSAKLEAVVAVMPIASYSGCDWRKHVDEAIEKGAGIAAFPPFFCLAPHHRVLTDDLRWVAVGDVKAGDVLLACEEEPAPGNRCRRWQRSTVILSEPAAKDSVRVHLENGGIIECSADHPWLADIYDTGGTRAWTKASDLEGKFVLRELNPWQPSDGFDAGWLSGIFDGEGSVVARASCAPKLHIAQNSGPTAQRIIERLSAHGFDVGVSQAFGKTLNIQTLGGLPEMLRALGTFRPERLIAKLQSEPIHQLAIRSRGQSRVKVLRVEQLGLRSVQSLMTTSKTYIGEGYVMHNSGDYEKQFEFIHKNVDWPAPTYDLYDPKRLCDVVDKIHDSGVPYCILTDQVLEGRKPILEYVTGRKVPHFCYANTQDSSYRHFVTGQTQFPHKPIALEKLTAQSKVTVVQADHNEVNWIKDMYLQRSIVHTGGMMNFFVYVDDMLLGALVFTLAKYPTYNNETTQAIYLLSDVTTTREAKLSKLVARLASSNSVLRKLNIRYLNRFNLVVTTARSHNPVSMKYRGIYELLSRRPADDPTEGNILQYGCRASDETPEQMYQWWWKQYGKKEVERARKAA